VRGEPASDFAVVSVLTAQPPVPTAGPTEILGAGEGEGAMADTWTKVNLDDVEDAAVARGFGDRWEARVAGQALGAQRTGLTLFRIRPGRRSPFVHRHREAEEIYVVLAGEGTVKLGEELRPVRALDAIRIAPQVPRAFEAGPDGLELLVFGAHHENDGEPVDDDWVK
jgi:quercetin dioxygenase-like cupin family protein